MIISTLNDKIISIYSLSATEILKYEKIFQLLNELIMDDPDDINCQCSCSCECECECECNCDRTWIIPDEVNINEEEYEILCDILNNNRGDYSIDKLEFDDYYIIRFENRFNGP